MNVRCQYAFELFVHAVLWVCVRIFAVLVLVPRLSLAFSFFYSVSESESKYLQSISRSWVRASPALCLFHTST